MRECYTSKVLSKQACLIAKIKLEKSVQLYRVFHVSLTFLIWLKMALKYIVDVKARHFYNHKDPPFDIKHQLMSVDPVPVLKIDLK